MLAEKEFPQFVFRLRSPLTVDLLPPFTSPPKIHQVRKQSATQPLSAYLTQQGTIEVES